MGTPLPPQDGQAQDGQAQDGQDEHTEEQERQLTERAPIELSGAELAALLNTFSLGVALMTGNLEVARNITPAVIDSLNLLTKAGAEALMIRFGEEAGRRLAGIGHERIINTADVERSAVLGGFAGTNHTPGGMVS